MEAPWKRPRPADRGHGTAPPTVGAGQDDQGWPEARHGAEHHEKQPGAAGGGDRQGGPATPRWRWRPATGRDWAADTLAAAGAEVYLAHPLGVKAFSHRRVKNDELDARDLADLLRMGRLAEAWIAPPEIRELREITRYRGKLVHIRTSCKDQVPTGCWPSSASR